MSVASFVVGFRDSLRNGQLPVWLTDRPGFRVGFAWLRSMATILDLGWLQISEGIRAACPGVGTPTALPLLGQSRGLVQGEAETDAAYAARLVGFRETWEGAGSSEKLALAIQDYLGNDPTVRVVDRAGNWVVAAPGGVTTLYTAATSTWTWNWDSLSNPERNISGNPWWSDVWIIVSPPEWAETTTGGGPGSLTGIWGTPDPGIGHAVTRVANDAIRSLAREWKGAHVWVEAIVWTYDATLFDPTTVNAGNPDGTWGNWAYGATRSAARQPTRNTSARYWIPVGG